MMKTLIAKIGLAAGCLLVVGAMEETDHQGITPAQVVALDECDPATFNLPGNVGPGFCKNVALGYTALGYTTTFSQLFAEAASGTPDAKWDFEPDNLTVKEGTPIIAVNQGGEPHTFTEVANFGGGFVPPLNGGESAAPECAAGFSSVAVARTRILQGSQLQVAGLSKGTHHFQCCIHPWMRMTVVVKWRGVSKRRFEGSGSCSTAGPRLTALGSRVGRIWLIVRCPRLTGSFPKGTSGAL